MPKLLICMCSAYKRRLCAASQALCVFSFSLQDQHMRCLFYNQGMYAGYWAVESTEKTAVNGVWRKGPGKDLFDVLDQVSAYPTPLTKRLRYILWKICCLFLKRVRAKRMSRGLSGTVVCAESNSVDLHHTGSAHGCRIESPIRDKYLFEACDPLWWNKYSTILSLLKWLKVGRCPGESMLSGIPDAVNRFSQCIPLPAEVPSKVLLVRGPPLGEQSRGWAM